MSKPVPEPPIRLQAPFSDPVRRAMFQLVGGALEKLLAIDQINQTYIQAVGKSDDRHFSDKVLDVLKITYAVSEMDLDRIPREGPIVVVANHPFGGIEGIILCALLNAVRRDVKLMANFLLEKLPAFRDSFIFVDPFGGEAAARANLKGLKDSIQWLRGGHALGIFPAGEVSHIDLRRGGVADTTWAPSVARLIRRTESPVLPVFFQGSNGLLFNLLGLVHPRLRTALLPHEVVNKRNQEIHIRIGNVIPFKKVERLSDDQALMDYLRMRTYYLENRPGRERRKRRVQFPLRVMKPREVSVAPAVDAELLERDVRALPLEQVLVDHGPFLVLYARADQLPHVLREIGRLRELTFRAAGEGTGQAVDIDRFDDYYYHLFVWQKEKREIVGAYRLGPTDLILERLGKRGLYTSTLFRYRMRLLREISPALEMGRSFVRREYQRSFSSLLLLWRGIGAFVVRHPRYKILFGPVSINDDYQSSTRRLLVSFLKMNNYLPDLARLVKARTPLRPDLLAGWKSRKMRMVVDDLDDVEELIADIETDLKGVPILLKQYLKMGGRLLGFNVDPAFSNVLDGLILVDVTKTDPRVLERYFTKEGVRSIRAYHGLSTPE